MDELSRKKPNGADKRGAQELVNDFVRVLLRDGDQEVAAIERAARDGGLLEQARPISQDRRFRKARELLGVEAYQRHRHWFWRLPAATSDEWRGFIALNPQMSGEQPVAAVPAASPATDERPIEPEPIDEQPIDEHAAAFGAVLTRVLGATADDPPSEEVTMVNGTNENAVINERPTGGNAITNDALSISPPAARSSEPRPSYDEFDRDPERAAALARVAEWRAGFAKLDRQRPPPLVSHHRWCAFLDDAERFLNSRWALIAASLGTWTSEALFGFNPHRGLIAVAQLGLLWHVEGGKILELSGGDALVERARTPRPHTRRQFHPATRAPWDTERRRPVSPAGEQSQQRYWVRA
jgi:hypothetical protein